MSDCRNGTIAIVAEQGEAKALQIATKMQVTISQPIFFKRAPQSLGRGPKLSLFCISILKDTFDWEIVAFSQWVQPTERERAARQDFTSRVEQVVLNLWPTASVKVWDRLTVFLWANICSGKDSKELFS